MSKCSQVIEKQIDYFIAFMENCLIHRKFTSTETANMREGFYTIVHTAQTEVVVAVAGELNNELNEENAALVSKLASVLKNF